ncbi:MAG: sugar phosphate isomerase/epimerase [Gemmataceae bacterium]|nr:sugar phosphate isomerase/epimerase [Gemmataceae bacterium]MCI0741975.1 sugar phosphate isomerase/epimerase [Gemmataceae bacterium]
MRPCLSQTTTLPCPFADDVAAFADAGCQAMEVWLTKLETHLETHSPEDTKRLLAERGMTLAAAAYQGGLLLSQGEQRKAHYDHFRKRLEICQELAIPTMLVVADFVGEVDSTALERADVSLTQAAQWAAGFGIRLALEFRAKNAFCASLDTALALVAQCGQPNVGVNFDVFHYYTGPSKFEDLALLTKNNLAHVQVCDVAGVPRELAADTDRVLPGDGDFQLQPLFEMFRQRGYDGYVSLELMNTTLWRANPTQVAEIGLTALRKCLGLATQTRRKGASEPRP